MTTPWLRFSGATLTLLMLLAAAFGIGRATTGGAIAQDSVSRVTPPSSAGLLRRLSESADAFRTGDTVFLVASDTGNYEVVGGFATMEQARRALVGRNSSYHIYPTLTQSDIRGQTLATLPGCYKNDITTAWVCPPKLGGVALKALRMSDVEFIEVTFRLRQGAQGEPVQLRLSADSVSSMVFTVDAYDRFIAPYYLKMFGPAFVKGQRDTVLMVARSASPAGR